MVLGGIQQLVIAAITLSKGRDNPQLISEPMDSTGKDLSTAGLVYSFVLIGLLVGEREGLYANYWRKTEEIARHR